MGAAATDAKKTITLGDFLVDSEIKQAIEIYQTDLHNFHKRVVNEIILPVIDRINRDLGQENDADYLAFIVEFAFTFNPPPDSTKTTSTE